jgi:hypothetical protein
VVIGVGWHSWLYNHNPAGSAHIRGDKTMVTISIEEHDIKDLVKQVILELLEERQDLFGELFAEAVEDLGLINAIKEGEATPDVSRSEVFSILDGAA